MLRTLLLLVAVSVAAASLAVDHPVYDLDGLEAEHLEFGGANAEEFMKGLSLIETEVELDAEAKGSSLDWSNIGNQPLSRMPDSEHQQMRKPLRAFRKTEKERVDNVMATNKYGQYWLQDVEAAKEDAKRSSTPARQFYINRINYVGNSYLYKKDPRGDPWKTPNTFVTEGGGDCEDYSILKMEALQRLGFRRSDMMIMVGYTRKNILHAVLLVRNAGKYWVLDNNLRSHVFEYSDYVSKHLFRFLYLLNHESMWMKKKLGVSGSTVVRRVTVDKKDYGACSGRPGTCLHMTWCEQQGHSWVSGACPGLANAIRCCHGSSQAGEDTGELSYVIRIQPQTVVAKGLLGKEHEAMCMFSSNTGDKLDESNTVETGWTSGHTFAEQMLIIPFSPGSKLFGRCYARKCADSDCGVTAVNVNDIVVLSGALDLEVDVQESIMSPKFHKFKLGSIVFNGEVSTQFDGLVQVAHADSVGKFA